MDVGSAAVGVWIVDKIHGTFVYQATKSERCVDLVTNLSDRVLTSTPDSFCSLQGSARGRSLAGQGSLALVAVQ